MEDIKKSFLFSSQTSLLISSMFPFGLKLFSNSKRCDLKSRKSLKLILLMTDSTNICLRPLLVDSCTALSSAHLSLERLIQDFCTCFAA